MNEHDFKSFTGSGPASRTCLIWMDMDLIGEGMGPRQQPGLRRRAAFDQAELSAILQGCMLGRGAQTKSDQGEATVPCPTDMVWVHTGQRPESKREVKRIFRLESSKSDAIDCNMQDINVIFNEESIKARKSTVGRPYTQTSFSASPRKPWCQTWSRKRKGLSIQDGTLGM